VWDATTGAKLASLAQGGDGLVFVAMSPDGTRALTSGGDGTIVLWDAATGAALGDLWGTASFVPNIAFTAGGGHIVTGGLDGTVRVWRNAPTSTTHAITDGKYMWAIGFAGNRTAVAAGTDGGKVIDASTGRVDTILTGHAGSVLRVAGSPDGRRVASTGQDGTGRVWSLDGKSLAVMLGHRGAARSVAWSPDGAELATVGADGTARVWRVADGVQLRSIDLGSPGVVARWSPDGKRLLIVAEKSPASLRDAATGEAIAEIPFEGMRGLDGRFSDDGARAVVIAGGLDSPVVGGTDGTSRYRVHHDVQTLGAAFAPDGRLATVSVDGTIRLWGTDGTMLRDVRGAAGAALATAAFRPDGRVLAVGGQNGTVYLYDVDTGHALAQLALGHTIYELAWRDDGAQLAIAQDDRAAILWDLPDFTGTPDELDRRLRCAGGWRKVGEALTTADPDPSACAQ
jgi:WD40 repeat protein